MKAKYRMFLSYLLITGVIMLAIPWIIGVAAPPEASFAFVLLLLFVADPIWSAVLGIISGTDGHRLWPLPIVNAGLFVLGISLSTQSVSEDFWVYALVYLAIGEVFFAATLLVRRRRTRKLFDA